MASSWKTGLMSWLGIGSPSIKPLVSSRYQSWTRQQLVDRLHLLESTSTSTTITTAPSIHRHRHHDASKKPFDFDQYPQHRIALKVAYLGWRYLGFAAQKDTQQTVEAELFRSLLSSRLIQDMDSCEFTRCGRTDKGVSGLGQVIALNVRHSSTKKQQQHDTTATTATTVIPYVDVLNNLLPDDIRILAWSPVSSQFNARFDCLSRTYKYMFLRQDLDLQAMQDAAQRLVGTHDYRHFCKLDPSKQVNYTRTIHAMEINTNGQQCELVICGSAFLWHQVRCIMSILFLVGQRLEPPSVVDDLLNVARLDAKPDYPLASDLPLVLWDCDYPEGTLDWQYSTKPDRLHQHWDDGRYDQTVRAWLYQSFANQTLLQQQQGNSKTVILGAGRTIRSLRYRPLLQRARADSEQVKRAKYHAKLERKLKMELL